MTLPSYDELPVGPAGGRLGWRVFGQDDQIGLINLLTPERIAAAATLVKRGATFPLDQPLGTYDPALTATRGNPDHNVVSGRGELTFDDFYDNFYPQGGSQWDSLAHVAHLPGQFYNGATGDQIRARERNTIDHVARHGVAGRAVVLDIPATLTKLGVDYDPGSSFEITAEHLAAAAEHGHITHQPGDFVLMYTGFEEYYAGLDQAARDSLPQNLKTPGLAHSEETARYLWNIHASSIASDNFAVEAWPAKFGKENAPFGFIHQMLIGSFGMALGELWHLRELVADCRESGVYEGLLVSAPFVAPGGIGSTANCVVLK
ncbi:MAG: cyclase family protein [Cumulibacter sp.]